MWYEHKPRKISLLREIFREKIHFVVKWIVFLGKKKPIIVQINLFLWKISDDWEKIILLLNFIVL